MSRRDTLVFFARHEARLAIRDWVAMMSGGRPGRERIAIVGILLFVAALHVLAFMVVGDFPQRASHLSASDRIVLTGTAFFSWALMLAQALESVTRVVYGRADLDLVASSPAPLALVVALRSVVAAIATTMMTGIIVGPFINALAVRGGPAWLGGYGVLTAMGMSAAALAILITLVLFMTLGARRTRTVSQVLAAVIGAGFVIGAQAVGILAYGEIGRFAVLRSAALVEAAPGPDSVLWWPSRAAMGDLVALGLVVGIAAAMLTAAVVLASRHFAVYAVAVAGDPGITRAGSERPPRPFRARSPAGYLRKKELRLLVRDPWLLSQTLMQILYLLPPALMLWKGFGAQSDVAVMLAPVVVMAAGQLAGGLAWLAVSGEDAPELLATAPVTFGAAIRAKIEAVSLAVAIPIAPLVAAFAVADPWAAVVAVGGVALAAASSTAIQFFFRKAAKRSHFRRRQTASRIATFAEAFSSISWAGATGLAAAASWYAMAPAGLAALILAFAWMASPRQP